WLALIAAAVLLAPALLGELPRIAAVWPYVAGSAVTEAVYVILLAAAYRAGDLSVVYPVARGTAPLLLACWTALFLGQVPRPGGVLGIGVLGLGVIVVARTAGDAAPVPAARALGVSAGGPVGNGDLVHRHAWTDLLLILGVALCVSVYSVIDAAAVQRAPAAAYESAVCALGAVLVAPVVVAQHGWLTVRAVLRRNWVRVVVVGGAMGAAYVAVLVAFRLAPVAYVGALREVSIVIAAVAGWHLLGERGSVARVGGAVVIVLGTVCIVVLG